MKNETISKYRDEFIAAGLKIGNFTMLNITRVAGAGNPCFQLFLHKVKSKSGAHTEDMGQHTLQLHIILNHPENFSKIPMPSPSISFGGGTDSLFQREEPRASF